jgi:hypothetical protein
MARPTVDNLGEYLPLVVESANPQEQVQVGVLTLEPSPKFCNTLRTTCIRGHVWKRYPSFWRTQSIRKASSLGAMVSS